MAIWPILPQVDTGIKERTEAKATHVRGRSLTVLQPGQYRTAHTSTLHSPLQPREKRDVGKGCAGIYTVFKVTSEPSDISETHGSSQSDETPKPQTQPRGVHSARNSKKTYQPKENAPFEQEGENTDGEVPRAGTSPPATTIPKSRPPPGPQFPPLGAELADQNDLCSLTLCVSIRPENIERLVISEQKPQLFSAA